MSDKKYLTYRGHIKALTGIGATLLFVTEHPEDQPTGIHRLDVHKAALKVDPLPCGGCAIIADDNEVWVAGTDQHIYKAAGKSGKPSAVGDKLSAQITQLAFVNIGQLAALVGDHIHIIDRKSGKIAQSLDLPEPGTCFAIDPSGQWLVAGTNRGTITTFECEDKKQFVQSESDRLHEGAVTALLFETDELRFFSAGADRKLLTTFARGKLEPEDKGRDNNHSEPIPAMVWSAPERFITGSADKQMKSWPRSGFVKPATYRDGIGKIIGMTTINDGKKSHLVIACTDNTLRVFPIDDDGKLGDMTVRFSDAYALAKHELSQDVGRREGALKALAKYEDNAALSMIAQRVTQDADHGLRLLAAQLLNKSAHARAPKLIEQGLSHTDEAVRVEALKGLRKQLGDAELRPLDLALKTEKADIGVLAVQALEKLAKDDDQALARLTEALDAKTPEIRQAVLTALEKVYGSKSPEAELIGLGCNHADIRRLALLRLYQRKLLTDNKVQAALRWRGEDQDDDVRRTAFLLSLFTRPKLVDTLRERDPALQRQLKELEATATDTGKKKKADDSAPAKKATAQEKIPVQKKSAAAVKLAPTDYEPLLQATASRALDTCLRGARGLAVLHDVRAFGLLLQLSREDNKQARVEVCYAMAALEDERSVNRLRSLLYDREPPVRDAAFTALAHIYRSEPLTAAESGLNSSFEDVRRRGLQVLVTQIKKKPPKSIDDTSWQLMLRALNDSHATVRSEATKACLNSDIAGGGIHTLRYLLQSLHADVRLEVLTEVMAQIKESWAWNLLLEFYNDADPMLRADAFDFAIDKNKKLEPLEAALVAQYTDIRTKAIQTLAKKHTSEAEALLVQALGDKDKAIRQLSLSALISDDVRSALETALTSEFADIRVGAAIALAKQGNTAALKPLLELATAPEPEQRERVKEWTENVERALNGLAELGDPGALTDILPLLDNSNGELRKLATRALIWCSRRDSTDALRTALQHSDTKVKYNAAFGLALVGDSVASSMVFSKQAETHLTPEERLVAALALGAVGEDQLVVFLDDDNEHLRKQALLLLMLLEWKQNGGTPTRCLSALSSRMPRVRLTAARAVESFADPEAFGQFVVQLVNNRGEEQAWTIAPNVANLLAELITFGDPHPRARTALLLQHFVPKEQSAFNQAWANHVKRFADAVAKSESAAKSRQTDTSKYTQEQLQEVAFGAYVGLVRGTSGDSGSAIVRVRQSALNRLFALAKESEHYKTAVLPVCIQALADPNQAVRMQAFEQLQQLGLDKTTLGSEALEAGHLDLGVKGLELLSAGASTKEGQDALDRVMRTRTDALAIEAAKLLLPSRGKVEVAKRGLEATSEDMRKQAVAWLVEKYDEDDKAKKALRGALQSRYAKTRNRVALDLAAKKDSAAYDALVELLGRQEDPARQNRITDALVTLGDTRSPAAFLDRIENDPSGTAQVDHLLRATGNFRRTEVVDRLLQMADKQTKWRRSVINTLTTISGFDQHIADPEEERTDQAWLEKQHPRHTDVLAKLMDQCFTWGETNTLRQLMPGARWAKGKDVEPVLMLLLNHPDTSLRNMTVDAFGWRLRKRNGSAEPLVKALQAKDPQTQFIAAEGLAKGGRDDGMSTLMASIDFQTDFNLRRRAVMALGELADQRSLDVLLNLANEEGHALQEAAAEALGHMGKSDKADEIFQLLQRLARGYDGLAASALRGLRWFNTRAGWQVIRDRAQDTSWYQRYIAIDLLGYNDDPATRDLLISLLTDDADRNVFNTALTAARRLWGQEALEPDLAVVQHPRANTLQPQPFGDSLKRVCERGTPEQIFAILSKCKPDIQDALATSLMNRQPPPLQEARAALTSTEPKSSQLAAHILGRAGHDAADAGKDLQKGLAHWGQTWTDKRAKMIQDNRTRDDAVHTITECLQSLLWAAGRIGVAEKSLLDAAQQHGDDLAYRPIRRQAVTSLGEFGKLSKATLDTLEHVATGNDPESRAVASDVLARFAPERAAKMAEQLLTDRISFNQLTKQDDVPLGETLQKAAAQVHYQGVALPQLVLKTDIATLMDVLKSRSLPEATRLGAVEALAAMGDEGAEEQLATIGNADAEEDEIRKAAWRGLRRSKRLRARGQRTGN